MNRTGVLVLALASTLAGAAQAQGPREVSGTLEAEGGKLWLTRPGQRVELQPSGVPLADVEPLAGRKVRLRVEPVDRDDRVGRRFRLLDVVEPARWGGLVRVRNAVQVELLGRRRSALVDPDGPPPVRTAGRAAALLRFSAGSQVALRGWLYPASGAEQATLVVLRVAAWTSQATELRAAPDLASASAGALKAGAFRWLEESPGAGFARTSKGEFARLGDMSLDPFVPGRTGPETDYGWTAAHAGLIGAVGRGSSPPTPPR